jgi:hypothetical protein
MNREASSMMGDRLVRQESLFYQFRLDNHIPADHMLRVIDRFVDLDGLRRHLAPFYSTTGRPSIDPELMIRMLLVGYCFGIRSERRLTDEELIEGLSFPAYRRVASWILTPTQNANNPTEMIAIDPVKLAAAHADDTACKH